MGFLISVLCHLLFIHGAFQCYQARLKFTDPALGDNENTYHDVNEENYADSRDSSEARNKDEGDSDEGTSDDTMKDDDDDDDHDHDAKIDQEDQEEAAETDEAFVPSERRKGHLRRGYPGKRRMSKKVGVDIKHHRRPNYHRKASDERALEESDDHDRETAHFYFSKNSEISNDAVILGPSPTPVSIQIIDTTPLTQKVQSTKKVSPTVQTQKLTTRLPTSIVSTPTSAVRNSKIGLDNIKKLANITSENNDIVPFNNGFERIRKRKIKTHITSKKGKDALTKRENDAVLANKIKNERRMIHHHDSLRHGNPANLNNGRLGHKHRKHKFRNEGISTKKEVEKYHLNDEEHYANLSLINKGLQSAAKKRLKNAGNGGKPSNEETLELEESLDNVEDDGADDQESGVISEEDSALREESGEVEKEIDKKNLRIIPRKGILNKIEHGDWVYQVTLLPLPDYSIKKRNRTRKSKLKDILGLGDHKNVLKDVIARKVKLKSGATQKIKKSIDKTDESEKSSNEQEGSESVEEKSDHVLESDGENENKRNERDTEPRAARHSFQLPNEGSIFNRYKGKLDIKDEFDQIDRINDEPSLKNDDEHVYGNRDVSEKGEYYYEYDNNFNGDEKSKTDVCTNKTTTATSTSCSSTVETTCTTKQRKLTTACLRGNESLQSNACLELDQSNKTVDPYEKFLRGVLADVFVEEVLRKVKLSRKIARELGYINETDETCDRCIELKPSKLPDLAVMRNALCKCPRNCPPVRTQNNCSTCCAVPRPMLKYLDLLAFCEKENEKSFYSKIQDDSTFIFTGDYPETLFVEGGDAKSKYKYEYAGPLHKDTFDQQHLRDDLNEEKYDGKVAGLDASKKSKVKSTDESTGDETTEGKIKEIQNESKRYLRRFSKTKTDNDNDGPITSSSEKDKPDSLVKQRSPNTRLRDINNPGIVDENWNGEGYSRKMHPHGSLSSPEEAVKKSASNFDRYYGKGDSNYMKQFPSKNSPGKPHANFKFDNGESSRLKDVHGRNGLFRIPSFNRMYDKDDLGSKSNFDSYLTQKDGQYQKVDTSEKYKGLQSKYDVLYDSNGEYSLYPNLDGRPVEDLTRMSGNYKVSEAENARMVKRYAEEGTPAYDDEPSVFFEIPNIEYELYK